MIRLAVSNQRGGVGKTTTAVNYACYLAQRNLRTLLVDTDAQGSIGLMLDLAPKYFLGQFLVEDIPLEACVVRLFESLDVLCSNKQTVQAEAQLLTRPAAELTLKAALSRYEHTYAAVVLDVSPAIGLMQTCAMIYARRVLIPVNMDLLSLSGAKAVCETVSVLNDILAEPIQVIGLMPCQVHQGLAITRVAEQGLEAISGAFEIPILPAVRTDQSVNRAFVARRPLLLTDPNARAARDYIDVFEKVTNVMQGPENGKAE